MIAFLVRRHERITGPPGTDPGRLCFELLVPGGQYLLRVWSDHDQVVLR